LAFIAARSASVRPAAARISLIPAFLPRPYSATFAAVAPARLLVAAYCSRRPESVRRISRTARWLRSASEPNGMGFPVPAT
jgi:hypothetical protein